MDLFSHFRSQLRLLNSEDLHKKLINHYVQQTQRYAKFKKDIDVIRENHKFLWDNEEPKSWEEQLAKKYYDRLFKEYCIADLSHYQEGKVALRWQIEAELVSGKGQFICGEKHCKEKRSLKTWEVNFGYIEQGEKKNALVKLRLCNECSDKLNYKHKKKEVKKNGKRKRLIEETKDAELDYSESAERFNVEGTDPDEPCNVSEENGEDKIWKTANCAVEEKSRDADFEEFLNQLLL